MNTTMNLAEHINELKYPVVSYGTCFNHNSVAFLDETALPFDVTEVEVNASGECINLKYGDDLRDFNFTENGNYITSISVRNDRETYIEAVIDVATYDGDIGPDCRDWAVSQRISPATWYRRTRKLRAA